MAAFAVRSKIHSFQSHEIRFADFLSMFGDRCQDPEKVMDGANGGNEKVFCGRALSGSVRMRMTMMVSARRHGSPAG